MHPLVSLVMLSWNRKDDVRQALTQIAEIDYVPIEVIVVDNGSTDGTADMIDIDFPSVRLIRIGENIGIAAYNSGFSSAQGKYIVILDDDSYPASDAITRMVDAFDNDEKLGVVAFDVRHPAKKPMLTIDSDSYDIGQTYQMSFNGAGAGIRTDLFRAIGWYPAEFFLYWNEQDTAFRVLDAGYKIQTFPDIIAWHLSSPKNRESDRAAFYYTRNAFWLVWKHYPLGAAISVTLQLVHGCLFHSLEQRSWVYVKAMMAAFLGLGALSGKRSPIDRATFNRCRVALESAFSQFR